jgi:two-component system, NarL family, nitrate/nitrite response regulator NarL
VEAAAVLVGIADPLTHRGLRMLLQGAPSLVLADDVEGADVVLLEGGDEEQAESRVPVLRMVVDLEEARGALRSGAAGVLHRAVEPNRLFAAITAVAAGLVVVDPVFHGLWAPREARGPSFIGLTTRELEVVEQLASGQSNRAIAQELGISTHTVKFHVASILDKLGAETRTEAVVLAVRGGVLSL